MSDRFFARVFHKWMSQADGQWLYAEPRGGDDSDGCVRCYGTNVRPFAYHSWGGGLGTHEGLRAQKTASAGPAEYFELSSDDGRPADGERPAALLEPRPQERDRRHTGVGYEIAKNLEVPVPQMGGTAARRPPVLRHLSAGGCRAGYRSAEDLTGQDSAALGRSSAPAADGGTVGACADCRVLFFAPAAYCRADR